MRRGDYQAIELTPEISELEEEGFLIAAQNELMYSAKRKHAEWLQLEKIKEKQPLETEVFSVDIEEAMRSGIFISGTSQCGKTTLAFHIAKKLIENDIIVFVVDPTQAWYKFRGFKRILRIFPLRQKQKIQWSDETTLFDVSRLNPFEQQQFIEAFCGCVMQVAINRSRRPKIIVVFEECHTAFYNGSMRAKRSRESVRLLTQGGNFSIRFIAITQFLSMCDKLLVKLAQQRYMGRTSEPNDLSYLSGIIGKHIDELPYLERGQFLYSFNGQVTKIEVQPEKVTLA
jgi:DNA helicase HerA-like ATPase